MNKEVMKQALDAVESIVKEMRVTPAVQGREYVGLGIQANNAIDALRAALAEQPAANVSLPTPANVRQGWNSEEVMPFYGPAYTADQMRSYAQEVLAAAIPQGHCVVKDEPVGTYFGTNGGVPNVQWHSTNIPYSTKLYAARPGEPI